ncbi:MAG: WG repeat-containing protein [Coleofasciculus sp. S288]|nr:WG repeat-containing protein [Coleofasciculus sp. S288]
MTSNSTFSDIQTHWAKDCIRQLQARNLISGYPDGTFRPNASITRAEFAALLSKAFANIPSVRSAIPFKDVPAKHWAYPAIQAAYRTGFLSGYPDHTFKPNQPIPRVQVLVALVSGLKYSTGDREILKKYYDDVTAIPNYAVNAIAAATEKRLVVNYPNLRRLNPNQNATRADVAAFICRALKIPGVPLQYIPGMEFVVIPPQFEEADSFNEGLARVKVGEKWGYIDKTGKFAIQPQLDEANSFSQGLALVRTYQTVQRQSVPLQDGTVTETRGVWLTSTASQVFNSKQTIAEAMDFLAKTGFNVVFPVVWNNGTTFYPSRIMRDTFGLEINPRYAGRDPLGELIVEAKRVGLAVIPWFEYGFASSFSQNGGQIIAKKPEWAARDASGNLLKKNNFEWMNALNPEVQDFLRSLVLEVVKNYEITGIQGDDRMPALPSEGSYDARTVERYFRQFNQNPSQNAKDPQWLQWRADILTDFLTRLYRELIALNPDLIISMSPSVYPWGYEEYLQDAQAWIDQGLVDLIHPQLYRRDFEGYKLLIDRLVTEQFTPAQLPYLSPGVLLKVGSYRMSPELLLRTIQYNRDRGISGEVFFFYEGLREENNALAEVLRTGPYAQATPFNPSQIKARTFTHRRVSGQYSYIDKTGKPVILPQFDWADSFSKGLARVKMGYKWGYIDTTGKLVSRLQFDDAEFFLLGEATLEESGLALVKMGSKYGYLDKTGNLVISPRFDSAASFKEGLAAVKISDQWFYIDKTGKPVILLQVDEANSFSEGLARIKVSDKYGYIDKLGQIVIQPQFDGADSFSEGLALVKIGNQWGYINSTGEQVIAPQFEEAKSFKEGLATVKIEGLWGYIDKTGKIAIAPEFDDTNLFYEGLALVAVGGKWGYIRKNLS